MNDSSDKYIRSHRLQHRTSIMGPVNLILALITIFYTIPSFLEGALACITGVILIPILRRMWKEGGSEWIFLHMIVLIGGVLTSNKFKGYSGFGNIIESLQFIFFANGIGGFGLLITFVRSK